jgi:phage terminase large subunit-like protein
MSTEMSTRRRAECRAHGVVGATAVEHVCVDPQSRRRVVVTEDAGDGHDVWPPNVEEWRVDREEIERMVEYAFATYDVGFLYADPWRWQDELADWAARWPDRIVEFPTNTVGRMVPAVDRFRTGLQEGRLTHDGDADLARHVLNARLRQVGRDEDGRGRFMLEKAGPGRLIDGCIGAVLAVEAAAQMPEPVVKPTPQWAFV